MSNTFCKKTNICINNCKNSYNINMENLNEKISKSIKQARKDLGISQVELAKRVGVTHAAISFWENGVNIPNVKDCWMMANELGISIDELVGRND